MDGFVLVMALIMMSLEELEKDQHLLTWKYPRLNLLIVTDRKR